MNPSDTMAPWLAPLGWLALEATAVVLAALAVQPFLRTAAARRSLWRAALLALVAVLAAELTGTGSQLPAQFRLAWRNAFPPAPALPPPTLIAPEFPFNPPPSFSFAPTGGEGRGEGAVLAPDTLPVSPEPLPEPPPTPSLHDSITPSLPPPPASVWPAGIWLAGLAALLMRAAWTHAGFAWLRLRHFLPAAETLRQRTQSLATRLGLRRRVRVLASERLRAPAAFGWVRPGVGVPGDFTARFAPAQQDVMLAHELAHLAARDPLWQLLADLVAAALWWHPLAWVARRQHRLAGELAADDASQALPDGPVVLAECLLALGHEAAAAPRAALGMAGFRSQLGRRVERLVALPHRDWQAPSRLRLALQTTVALLALAALALLPGCAANRSAGEAPSSLVAKWWQAKQTPVGDDVRSLSKNAEGGTRNAATSQRLVTSSPAAEEEGRARLSQRAALVREIDEQRKALVADHQRAEADYKKLIESAIDAAVSIEARDKLKQAAEAKLRELQQIEIRIAEFDRAARARLGETLRNLRDATSASQRFVASSPANALDISVGRQLFVDDFLIASNTLKRAWHLPALAAEQPQQSIRAQAPLRGVFPFPEAVWYDAASQFFKMRFAFRTNSADFSSPSGTNWGLGQFHLHADPAQLQAPPAVVRTQYESLTASLRKPAWDNQGIVLGFERDGLRVETSAPREFIPLPTPADGSRWSDLHPMTNGFLVVGRNLYFYFGGRVQCAGETHPSPAVGLATLRRDGFASLDAGPEGGVLTTKPVTFMGKFMFVNFKTNTPDGEMRIEILDADGNALERFSRAKSIALTADQTLMGVSWQDGAQDLSALIGKPVRFRFHLRNASLYSFWVGPGQLGRSLGRVAGGGPHFTNDVDTIGNRSYQPFPVKPLPPPKPGTLTVGDTLKVEVVHGAKGNHTLRSQVRVQSNGNVSLSGIAPVLVAGKTTEEARERIRDAFLAAKLENPVVTVSKLEPPPAPQPPPFPPQSGASVPAPSPQTPDARRQTPTASQSLLTSAATPEAEGRARLSQRAAVLQEIDEVQTRFAIAQRELATAQRTGPPAEAERVAQVVAQLDTRFKAATAELARLEAQPPTKDSQSLVTSSATIAPGDSLRLLVAEDDAFGGIYPVKRDGTITVKGVGRVPVGGRRLSDAQAAVKAVLEETQLRTATVTLEFSGERSGTNAVSTAANDPRVIYLAGEFITPGPLKLVEGETLTLTNALLRSGGITPNGDLARVKLLRIENGQGAVEEVNVAAILAGTRPVTNRALLPGDIIMVPALAPVVKRAGAINQPPAPVAADVRRLTSPQTPTAGQSLLTSAATPEAEGRARLSNADTTNLKVLAGRLVQAQTDSTKLRFDKGPQHPDTRANRLLIAALEQAIDDEKELLAFLARAQPSNPDVETTLTIATLARRHQALLEARIELASKAGDLGPLHPESKRMKAVMDELSQQVDDGKRKLLPPDPPKPGASLQPAPVAADVRRLQSNTERGVRNVESSQSLLTSAATNATPAPDALQAAQEEALRRQERKAALDKLLGEAGQFLKVKSWTSAVVRYEEAIGLAKALGGVPAMEKQYRDALAGLIHCRIQLAVALQESFQFKAAAAEVEKILPFEPNSPEAEQFKRFNERVEAAHGGRSRQQAPAGPKELLEVRSKVTSLVRDGRLYFEVHEYQEASKRLAEAITLDPVSDAAFHYLRLSMEAQFEHERRLRETSAGASAGGIAREWYGTTTRTVMTNIYHRGGGEVPFLTHSSKGAQRINRKLEEIVLPEVHFDAVPLVGVVQRLIEDAKKFDPEPDPKKKGLNFLINDVAPAAPLLDAAGNPVPVARPVALSEGLIRVSQPLKNLTLRQALDVICKTAELPTQFSVEEYAIAFIPRGPVAFYSRIFRVNPDTFIQGLQGVVGNPVLGVTVGGNNAAGAAGQNQPSTTTTAPVRATVPATVPATQRTAVEANALVRQFFQSAGVTSLGATNSSTQVFFNPENGLLIARGTTNDMRVIEQTIQKVQPSSTPLPPSAPAPNAPERDRPGRNSPASTNAPASLPPGVKAYYRTNSEVPFLTHSSKGAQIINRKLDEIILPEVRFDDVPLPQVMTWLDASVKKLDPEKKGLNFLINNVATDYVTAGPVAPTIGKDGNQVVNPPRPAKVAMPDLAGALVKVPVALTNLTLRQALDVICKTTWVKPVEGRGQGLKYSVEEYAIVFSPKLPEQPDRFSRIFKVDPELFARGLRSVELTSNPTNNAAVNSERSVPGRGAGRPALGGASGVVGTNQTDGLNILLRDYFRAAGVVNLGDTNAGPDATQVFFNDRNGLLLVRASLQDLDIIQMAIELLNNKPPQVLIEAKFVAIDQNDNKAVGFDWFSGNTAVKPPEVQPDGVRRVWIDREGNYKLDGRARSLDQIEDELKVVSQTNAGVIVRIGAEHEARYSDATPVFERLSRIGITNSSYAVQPELSVLSKRPPSAANPTGVFPLPASPIAVPAATGIVTNKVVRTNAAMVGTVSGILTAPQFAVVMRAFEQRDATSVRSLPKVTTPSGKQAVIEFPAAAKAESGATQGLKLEVLPSVDANGYTISFTVIVTRDGKRILEQQGVVWDAQTLMLDFPGAMGGATNRVPVLSDLPLAGRLFQPPAATNTPGRCLLFLTPTLVDPAGNRIHRPDGVVPFAPVAPAKK